MQNTVNAQIDLSALRDNLRVVRTLCPRSRIMAMVKGDAYGHGLLPVAMALGEADGLGVARLQEALLLRKAGLTQRALLLGTLLDATDLAMCSAQDIDVTAHDGVSVASIVAQAWRAPLRVWLKLDSGMHRMGLNLRAFVEADRVLSAHPGVRELIHMSHFSSAGNSDTRVMEQQISLFHTCHKSNSNACVSIANSAALISRPDTHADWVPPALFCMEITHLALSVLCLCEQR